MNIATTILLLIAAFFAGYWTGLKHSEILFTAAVQHINKRLEYAAHLLRKLDGQGKKL